MEIIQNLEPLLKSFWYIAIIVSFIFIVQAIMTFVGADSGDGLHSDFDGDFDGTDMPFQLFSLRNLINFLLGFSWSGISFYEFIPNQIILIFIATIIGSSFVYLFFILMKQINKLAEDNSFKISETLNKTAEVYLQIPENKSGKGKILISLRGSTHELEAITENEKIPSNTLVKIIKIENNDTLVVEKIIKS